MHRWWSRISCTTTTENSKSDIENGCLHPQAFNFVRTFVVQHSSQCTKLHVCRFRFSIDAFLVKLQNNMRSWLTRFWCTYHDWKLEIHFENGCLHRQAFNFVRMFLGQYSLQFTRLHVRRFRFSIESILVKLQSEMRSWLSRIRCTVHDWRLKIYFEKGFLHPQEFDFVRKFVVQHSSQLTKLHVCRFRFSIGTFLVKLQNEMRSWMNRFWLPNHDWKLEIHFENCCLHPKAFNFVRRYLVQHSSQFTRLPVLSFRFLIEAFLVKQQYEMSKFISMMVVRINYFVSSYRCMVSFSYGVFVVQ
jgi:hypothetical protein